MSGKNKTYGLAAKLKRYSKPVRRRVARNTALNRRDKIAYQYFLLYAEYLWAHCNQPIRLWEELTPREQLDWRSIVDYEKRCNKEGIRRWRRARQAAMNARDRLFVPLLNQPVLSNVDYRSLRQYWTFQVGCGIMLESQ